MKLLLLFYLHQRPKRPGEFSFCGDVFYWTGTCGNEWMLLAGEYVSLYTKTSNEKIKNLPSINPKITGQTPFQNKGLITDLGMLFFKVFNPEIQWLTTAKAIVFPLSALTLKTSDLLMPCPSTCLSNTFTKFSFYEQTHEHFYRLKSLFEHTRESAHAQKTAVKEWGLFRKIGLSKLSI